MSLRKRPSFAKSFRNSFDSSAKIFAAANQLLAHECHFAEQEPPFRSCELATKLQSVKIPVFAVKAPFRRVFRSYETNFGTQVPFRSTMTSLSKLRNGLRSGLREQLFAAKSTRELHSSHLFISLPEPDDARTSGHLLRSSLPAKSRQSDMARTRGAKSSSPSNHKRVPRGVPVQGSTSEPPRPEVVSPPAKPAPKNPPARRYLTRSGGRPLQKRARVESSEPIDLTEQSPPMTIKKVRDPTLIHFTIDGRHGILGARHMAEALHIPYEPTHFEDYRVWTNPSQLEMRRGVLLEALFKISEGYFFGPHHLIMATFLYFEEKVHKKKLQRADAIPLLFPRLLCQILEHLGYPSDPQLERKRIYREVFTLDKWNNMTAYRVEQPRRPQPVEIPAARRAFPRHIPEGIPIASPTISRAPPVTPASSEPSTSAEPRMAIPISEYRELCRSLTASQSSLAQEMAAIRACQEQMLTTQAQHTAILRPLQHHFGLPSAAEHLSPTTAVPHSQATESQAPPEEATEEAEPSA
uniref:Uncharacterized protein n=1 Tax=Vitis vinifera TaxID=29760 RepID=A5AD66_VITVI|nr:hypothetical protein VITISV_018464 [Vitis vinifera]